MKKYLLILLAFPAFAQDWSLVENLAPDGSEQSDFGANMVFAGDYLVVGWPQTFTEGLSSVTPPDDCGQVVTYEKVDGKYQQIAILTAADLVGACDEGDGFGFGLAYDNGRLAIGMPAGARAGTGRPGGGTDADSRVFLTQFEGGNWVLDEELTVNDQGNGNGIGFYVVLEDDVLLVGGHEYKSIFGFSFVGVKGVYVFEDEGSGFVEKQKLDEDFNLYGQDFDIENNQIVVGAWGVQALTQPGRVFVYDKQGDTWMNTQTIVDTRNSNLGNQIEIVGDTMAVGAVQVGGSGSVTIYNKQAGQWQEQQFIQASDAQLNDQFAIGIRLDEDELMVGATGGTDPGTTSGAAVGAVYHFVKQDDGMFVEQQKIESLESNEGNDQFGGIMIFNDTDLLVNETSGGTILEGTTEFVHYSRDGVTVVTPDTYDIDNKTSGVWQIDGATNQFISLQVLPDDRVLMYGNANHLGESIWLVGLGTYSENKIDFENVYSTSGGKFGGDFSSSEVVRTEAGTAMFAFTQCHAGKLMFAFEGIAGSEVQINKAIEIPGNNCGASNKNLPSGVSGSWYDPNRSGEGYTVYVYDDAGSQQAEVTWYTYDSNGNQMAVSGTGPVNDSSISIASMQVYAGAEFLNGNSTGSDMGSLTMSWERCRMAQVDYDFTVGGFGTGSMQVQQLSDLSNTDCGDLTVLKQ